jgi:hypothetical protein
MTTSFRLVHSATTAGIFVTEIEFVSIRIKMPIRIKMNDRKGGRRGRRLPFDNSKREKSTGGIEKLEGNLRAEAWNTVCTVAPVRKTLNMMHSSVTIDIHSFLFGVKESPLIPGLHDEACVVQDSLQPALGDSI